MTFKQLKNQIKEEQKQAAKEIRELKSKRKEASCGYVSGLDKARFNYRHKHIAYCMFFNKTPYELIEPKCGRNIFGSYGPIQSIIEAWIDAWTKQCMEFEQENFEIEDVCNCA